MRGSRVLWESKNAKTRVVINEGSSRSTKTYSLLQLFVILAARNNCLFSVIRKTLPALRSSAYRDFLEILRNNNIYNPANHNKSELIYKINNSEVEFFSIDQYDKVKGRKRDYLFINEANELSYNDFIQLSLRTTKRIFIDYNPSHDQYHWIETKLKTRSDVTIIHSTYKDNEYLDQETINEIERLQETDQNLWRIYGLGQMGILENLVYTHWKTIEKLPDGDTYYGLDFGYNNPSALIEIRIQDEDVYVKEILYESRLTNQDLINRIESAGISKSYPIYADSEDPQRIKEIEQAGYNIQGVDKEKGSVKRGIDIIKSRKLFITNDSVNTLKEIRAYKWQEKEGKPIEEPIKYNDHALDALRYAVYGSSKRVGLSLTWI